jgi:hypothetical protein
VGGLIFFVGGLGCCGACKENTGCLTAFSVILVILLIIQLIAVILAGALHSQIKKSLAVAMNETMVHNYGQSGEFDSAITESWNFMQMEMKCCGILVDGPKDWKYTQWYQYNKTEKGDAVPQSCCVDLVDKHNYSHPAARDPAKCYQAAFNKTSPDIRNKYAYSVGCQQKLDDWLVSSLAVVITGVVIIILVQITVLVMACCLKSSIQSSYQTL